VLTGTSYNLHWFDTETASDPIAVGPTFETPEITEATTYWVEDRFSGNMEEAEGGRTGQGDGQYHDNSIRWLIFDAAEDIVIHSVDVFANGSGEHEIGVTDAQGDVISAITVNIPDGPSTVILDLEVPEGEGYGLRSLNEDPQLWRDGPGSNIDYPYAIGDLATIQQSTAGGNNAFNYYYFFYNWVVQTPYLTCASDRVPVTITIVGVQDLSAFGMNVFPNPTNGEVQLTWDQSAQPELRYRLLDAFGRLAIEGVAQGPTSLDWSGLAAGIYTLTVEGSDASGSLQVVVQ
jgi:hypothetical protein